jgi:hypothetical protein
MRNAKEPFISKAVLDALHDHKAPEWLREGRAVAVKRLTCTLLSVAGYILSPLSFWNDLFVNFPIAYFCGLLCGLISQRLFLPGLVAGYWLSNIAGIVLLHKGVVCLVNPDMPMKVTRKVLIKDGLVTLLYTGVLIVLVKTGVLKFLPDYFN